MARKSKKKVEASVDDSGDATEEESVRENGDVGMDVVDDDIPSIVDKDSGDEGDVVAAEEPKASQKKSSEKKSKKKGKKNKKNNVKTEASEPIPFMDTFYQLSSEDSPKDRSIAARDLIHHCFLTGQGINCKDAAYALTRLMNGLCTGRAASRQGFASCLSSFLRVAHSPSLNEGDGSVMEDILKEDDYATKLKEAMEEEAHPAAIVRQKLLSTTQFLAADTNNNGKGQKDDRFGGKLKGIEERDHAFGRLFGILAVVRSGIFRLKAKDFPAVVVEGYVKDLIDLYHYKSWIRETSAHALVELLSSLDTKSNLKMKVANDIITPTLFVGSDSGNASKGTNREEWLPTLAPEQIAVALHLQTRKNDGIEYDYPLDEPLVTAESVPTLAAALSSTSSVVHPRCHFVWDSLWMYITEDVESQGCRKLRTDEEFSLVIEAIIQHVVVRLLLGKGEDSTTPTNERRSLALQIVCALSGSSDLKIVLPPKLVSSVICPDVVVRLFENVLCASGGVSKKKKAGGVEHHLKQLTSQAILDLVDNCCEHGDISRRMAFAKAFILASPRFDTKTKTQTVSSLLMLGNNISEASEESESQRKDLWQSYLSFLEEEIVSANDLHTATVYIELMYKLAKYDLARAPADVARSVIRFFLSGAFFDCSDLSDPTPTKKSSSKRKKKNETKSKHTPQELSSGLRIKEVLQANEMSSISPPARAIMSARFYSLLSDFVSTMTSPNRGGSKNKSLHGKGSKPESIYRALSEICGIFSLLETSGAKQFPAPSTSMDTDDTEDPMEVSKKLVLQVQRIANDALVNECDGTGDEDTLRAKAMFATSWASLMISLHLQLNSCGNADADGDGEEEEDEVAESVHEYISDLAECVDGFVQTGGGFSVHKNDDGENPLAAMAGLLVNILSSPVGGEESGKTNPIQASASKLARETVKLAWSSTISVTTVLNAKNMSFKSLVDEDVMSILIESVCGEKSMNDEENDDDDSMEDEESDGDLDDSAFVDAAGIDLDGANDDSSNDSSNDSSKDIQEIDEDNQDIELDPAKLENMLLEDSDAEMSESGVLEHHAGADKALARLIKLKQEARKASQTERERVALCNRLRCAGLLDSIFSESVFKSGWLPTEAVFGSIVPILRSRKLVAKSIQSSTSPNAMKSLNERNALLDRLSALVKNKLAKFRCSDNSAKELALKASSDIYEEIKRSLNAAHCSCCSVALITTVRCIPSVEDNDDVKLIYAGAVDEWSSRKATKIHACVFDDLIQRMPSLASLILIEPLMAASRGAHSAFLKCESIKLLSAIYKHEGTQSDGQLSKKAISSMKECCSGLAQTLTGALGDASLQKAKHRDEVLIATKQFVNYIKSQEGILTKANCHALQEALTNVGGNCKSAGMKQLCSQVSDTISDLPTRDSLEDSKGAKIPKSSKKRKKTRK